jgi:hypothetical protein
MCKIGEHEVRIDAVRAGLQTYNNEITDSFGLREMRPACLEVVRALRFSVGGRLRRRDWGGLEVVKAPNRTYSSGGVTQRSVW